MGKAIQSYYWQKVFIKICRGKDAVDLAVGSRESQSKRAKLIYRCFTEYISRSFICFICCIIYCTQSPTMSAGAKDHAGPYYIPIVLCTVRSMHSVHVQYIT